MEPLLMDIREIRAAGRYADARKGVGKTAKIAELRRLRETLLLLYGLLFHAAYFAGRLGGLMGESLQPGVSLAWAVVPYAILVVVTVTAACVQWGFRRRWQREIDSLAGVPRLPVEQQLIDNRVEAYTERVVRAIEAFNDKARRAALLAEGVQIGEIKDAEAVRVLTDRLASQRVLLEACLTRMRFWRNPLLAEMRDGQAPPTLTLDDALDDLVEAQDRLSAAVEADLAGGLRSRLLETVELDAVERELRSVASVSPVRV